MKCKYCQAELEDGNFVCPACGKENETPEAVEEAAAVEETPVAEAPAAEETAEAPAAEEAPAQQPAEEKAEPEIKEGKKAAPGKIALAIVAGVVVLAILVALVVSGIDGKGEGAAEETQAATEATGAATEAEETTPATNPADGNPDDATCKGSYTVTDDEIAASADTVVATMGDVELTNGQLQVFYWMEVLNFLDNYGDYAAYCGMDYTQPLDTQLCEDGSDVTMTWQQYFLSSALDAWMSYQSLTLEAEAAGFQMPDDFQTWLDELPASLDESALSNDLADGTKLVHSLVGMGASVEDYVNYMKLYNVGYYYFNELYSQIDLTAEEIEAYFAENEEAYAESDITKDSGVYIDVRHILLQPEGGTTDDDGNTTYSDEEWEACRASAQAVLDQWLAGDMTEDSFAALANEYSADSDGTDGGLYSDVYQGQMVEAFDDWCFDESRQVGDYGLVKTEYGYHVMYFSGSRDIWYVNAEYDLTSERASALIPAALEKHPATIDYSAIELGYVDLTQA